MAYLKCKQMADDDAYVQLLGLILFVVVNFKLQGGITTLYSEVIATL